MILDQHTRNQNPRKSCSPSYQRRYERRAVVNARINRDSENAEEAFTDNDVTVEASNKYTKEMSTKNVNEMSTENLEEASIVGSIEHPTA